MKLTKTLLEQLIKEAMTQSQYQKGSIEQARERQTGITTEEREFLLAMNANLKKAAELKNLTSAGRVTTLLNQLQVELGKLLDTPEGT